MNRRSFMKGLLGAGAVVAAPTLFIPKLTNPRWKRTRGGLYSVNHDTLVRIVDIDTRSIDGVALEMGDHIRMRLQEESFVRKILPPVQNGIYKVTEAGSDSSLWALEKV